MNTMNVWLINPYGPIPSEGWRDYRYVMFGKYLAASGHRVIWWTSAFSHHFKKFRSKKQTTIRVSTNFSIILVPSISYRSNIGILRAVRDLQFSDYVFRQARVAELPDCVLSSEQPFTQLSAAYRLFSAFGIPYIYDQMDLWPELFERCVPSLFKGAVRLALHWIYMSKRQAISSAAALSALSQFYLDESLRLSLNSKNVPRSLIYNGISLYQFNEYSKGFMCPESMLPADKGSEVWFIFAGSLGPTYDIRSILDAVNLTRSRNANFRVLIAGSGPQNELIVKHCSLHGCNLRFLGSLTPKDLISLYSKCDVGLCAYTSKSNVEMPDKFYDYISAGLAVINSLNSEVCDIINRKEVGLHYVPGDPKSLSDQMVRLIENPGLIRKFKDNSKGCADEYSAENQFPKICKLINGIAAVC